MAYKNTGYEDQLAPSAGNPSYSEAWALIEAARRMGAVVEYGDLSTKDGKGKLREALRLNLRIWTIIQAEQETGAVPLPVEVRQNILSLCAFIDKHTINAIVQPTAEKVALLIDINRNIAAGLLGNPGDDDDGSAEEADPSGAEKSGDDADASVDHTSLKIEA